MGMYRGSKGKGKIMYLYYNHKSKGNFSILYKILGVIYKRKADENWISDYYQCTPNYFDKTRE